LRVVAARLARAFRSGRCLTVFIPTPLAKVMGLKGGEKAYCYIDSRGRLVYAFQRAPPEAKRLKIRRLSTPKEAVYCEVTIPKKFAEALEIKEGMPLLITLTERGELVVEKLIRACRQPSSR